MSPSLNHHLSRLRSPGKGYRNKRSVQRLIGMLLLFPTLLTGCSTMSPYTRYFGVRPDGPEMFQNSSTSIPAECNGLDAHGTAACLRYVSYAKWAEEMGQAYRSRATMNEWSVYVAGAVALGALAAVGGLGVVGAAASETVGLLSVSTGFTSGFFGLLNNSERAGFYTHAANEIALARAQAEQKIGPERQAKEYTEAANLLAEAMSQWTTWLETQRSEAAVAAAQSEEVKKANNELADLRREIRFAKIVKTVTLVSIQPTEGTEKENPTVTLTTNGIDLEEYTEDLFLRIGGTDLSQRPKVTGKNTLDFDMPDCMALQDQPTSVSVQLRLGDVDIPGEIIFTCTK
jgi:hypothetical protein